MVWKSRWMLGCSLMTFISWGHQNIIFLVSESEMVMKLWSLFIRMAPGCTAVYCSITAETKFCITSTFWKNIS